MISKYIETHYTEILRKFKAVTRNHQHTEDLLQDCLLNFLEKGNDYTNQVLQDGKVQHYLIKMAHIQFNSATSPFYNQYRKNSRKSLELDEMVIKKLEDTEELVEDKQELVKDVKLYIGKLPVYERTISERHFVEGNSQREVSRYYNINRLHIRKDLNNIQNNIKITFNRENYKTK